MKKLSRSGALMVMAVLLLVGSVPASAQEQTGNLYGSVTDTQGGFLPGVRVELTGLGAPRTQFTNAQGQFRFLNLDPGNYQLTASLGGFSTVEYPDVDIRVGRNVTLEVQLDQAITDVITVTSESALLLDERKVARGTTISQVELEKIPTARDPWAIVTQTPGVLSDRVNVGGNESGQQAVFIAPGTTDDENSFAVDGVLITDMAAIGSSPTYYDFDQFEEIQVSTGGTDIEKVSAGAALNMVTKRGSNSPRGSARFLLTDADEQFGIFEQADADIGGDLENGDGNGGCLGCPQTSTQTPGNSINEVVDFGFEAGGPIVRDKLWVWGSYGRNDIKQFAQTGDPDNTLLENSAIKFNGQPVAANSAVGSWNRGDKIKDGRRPGSNFALEATWDQTGPTEIWKLEDTHVFSSDFYLTGLYSYVDGGFALQSKGSPYPNTSLPIEQEPLRDVDGIWKNSYYGGVSDRNTDNYQLDGSYFFNTGNVSHELKFGTAYRKFSVESPFGYPGRNIRHRSCAGLGSCDTTGGRDIADAFQTSATPHELTYTSGWVQDTLTSGKWTVNAGLRYDLQEGENLANTLEANVAFPDLLNPLSYSGDDGGFDWESVSPRVGVTYALGAKRRTLLRASYSQFAEQLSSANVTRVNPTGTSIVRGYFDDLNGDHVWQSEEPIEVVLDTSPDGLVASNRNDPNLDPSTTDELVFGVEHAFLPELLVGVDVTWRNTTDVLEFRNLVEDAAGNVRVGRREDYVPDESIGPNGMIFSNGEDIPNLPDGTPWSAQVFTLNPDLTLTGGTLLTNGDREREYLGGALTFTKRLSNRWMARGYFSYGDTEWTVTDDFHRFANPTDLGLAANGAADTDGELFVVQSAGSGAFQDVLIQSTWSANLNGMYQVAPDRPWGFNVAGNLFAREGYPLPYYYTVFTADGNELDVSTGNDVDDFRADDVFTVDLRLEKDMQLTDNLSGIVSLDAFNVLNDNYVIQRQRELSSPQANYLTQNLSPRIYRLGFRLNWR